MLYQRPSHTSAQNRQNLKLLPFSPLGIGSDRVLRVTCVNLPRDTSIDRHVCVCRPQPEVGVRFFHELELLLQLWLQPRQRLPKMARCHVQRRPPGCWMVSGHMSAPHSDDDLTHVSTTFVRIGGCDVLIPAIETAVISWGEHWNWYTWYWISAPPHNQWNPSTHTSFYLHVWGQFYVFMFFFKSTNILYLHRPVHLNTHIRESSPIRIPTRYDRVCFLTMILYMCTPVDIHRQILIYTDKYKYTYLYIYMHMYICTYICV